MNKELSEQVYNEYYLKVRNYILSKINNFYEAQDICSNVFLKVYENLDKYDESKASMSTWIFTITRNTLTDYYRTNKIHEELNENIAIIDEGESICNEENLSIMADALEQLDERSRDIILMHYYSKMTLKDIAEKIGISYAYVKILHQNALDELKNAFN